MYSRLLTVWLPYLHHCGGSVPLRERLCRNIFSTRMQPWTLNWKMPTDHKSCAWNTRQEDARAEECFRAALPADGKWQFLMAARSRQWPSRGDAARAARWYSDPDSSSRDLTPLLVQSESTPLTPFVCFGRLPYRSSVAACEPHARAAAQDVSSDPKSGFAVCFTFCKVSMQVGGWGRVMCRIRGEMQTCKRDGWCGVGAEK